MSTFICRVLSVFLVIIICVAVVVGCGDSQSPSETLQAGADNYAQGKEEVEYEIPGNSARILQDLIDSYTAMREEPEPIGEKEAQEIIDQTREEDQLDTTSNDTIGSDDDLEKMLAWMLDETKTTAVFTLSNGYTFEWDVYQRALDRAMRNDSIDGICVSSYGMSFQGGGGTLVLSYDLPVSILVSMKQETRKLVRVALDELNLQGKSDLEIIVAVNDYLCENNEYPVRDMAKYPGSLQGYAPESHTAYGLFKDSNAVCEGYSRACELLLSECGIDCINIWGDTSEGGHAWNMVKYDGAWYHVDVCWNDVGGVRKQFLLVSDDYMKESRIWDTAEYPVTAKTSYQW